MSKKTSYRINNKNQLVVTPPNRKTPRVLHGEFHLNKANDLFYRVKEPTKWHKKYNLPDKISFKGKWRLNPNYDLVLDVEKRKSLKLKGEIIDANENTLFFKIKSYPRPKTSKISFLRLKGTWDTDKFNRIVFQVKKKLASDNLTLKGAWDINKNNQITYEYQTLITKTKTKFTLEGYWDIPGKDRLRYILERTSDKGRYADRSYLDFHGFLETPNIYPAQGKIKYRVGIGLKKARRERIVVLTGKWKFSRKLGLSFEVDYGKGKVKEIKFQAELSLAQKDKLIFALYDRENRPLGMSITFKKKSISNKDFEYFLRLEKEGKTPRIEIGGKIKF